MNGSIEPILPLIFGEEDTFYKSHKNIKDVIRQNLKHLFYTAPGEKKRDIKFGIDIKSFLFEPLIQETKQNITIRVFEQINRYMPFLRIIKLDINFVEQYNEMYIYFKYLILNSNQEDVLNLQVKATK